MALRAQSNSKGRVRTGATGGLSGIPGQLFGQVFGFTSLRAGLTNSLKGSVSAGAVLAGGLSLKRALAGNVAGGATILANLSGGAGTLRGGIPSNTVLMAKLTHSLKGATASGATISGALSLKRALAGNMPGGATFTSALTGGGATMPSGASAIYYVDQATTQTNGLTYIPNAASTTAASKNLFFAPRRQFTNNNFWAAPSATITEGITGPDGLSEATRLTWAAAATNWKVYTSQFGFAPIPAGTYTAAVNARWRSVGSNTFQLGAYPSGLSTKTMTTSWQRFSATFTSDGTTNVWPMIFAPDGGAAGVDFEICDFNLFAGSSDLGATGSDTNLYLGTYGQYGGTPYAKSSNLIDLVVSTGIGAFALPSAISVGPVTIIAVTRKAPTSGAFNPLFAYATGGDNQWREFCYNLSGGGGSADFLYVSGGTIGSYAINPLNNFVDQTDDKLSFHAHVSSGTAISVYGGSSVGAELSASGTASYSAKSIQDLTLGRLQGSFLSNEKLFAFAIYPGALTQTQVSDAFNALAARAVTAGLTVPSRKIVVAEGDSITADGSYLGYQSDSSTTAPIVRNTFAVSGSTIANLASRASTLDAALPVSKAGRVYVLSVFVGTNDLNGTAGELSSFTSALQTYLDARKAAGWDKIIVGTIMDKTFGVTNATNRYNDVISANATMRGWVGTHCDAVADFAADSVMAPTSTGSNAGNTTYFSAGLHPTAAGHALMGPRWATGFNTL